MTPEEIEVTATITAPSEAQVAGSLVGPFIVATNQDLVSVSADPAIAVTDASGTPIDTEAVTDGQALYLDLRSSRTAGSATLTVAAQGTGSTGTIISISSQDDREPTKGDHAQSLILVTPSTTKTTDEATVTWDAVPDPVIATSLVDSTDGDRVLPWDGGTVVDTIAYQNLTVGETYTVAGELMLKSDGSGTGITGSATFTATEANGEVDVTFVVPEGYAGQSLVAFEWLFEGEIAGTAEESVAEHTDLDDEAQTVVIEEKPEDPPVPPEEPETPETPEPPVTPETPETPETPTENLAKTGTPLLGLGGVALLAILAGTGLMLTRRRA